MQWGGWGAPPLPDPEAPVLTSANRTPTDSLDFTWPQWCRMYLSWGYAAQFLRRGGRDWLAGGGGDLRTEFSRGRLDLFGICQLTSHSCPPWFLWLQGSVGDLFRSTGPLWTTLLLQPADYRVLHSVLTHFLFDQILKYYVSKVTKGRSQLCAIPTLGSVRQKMVNRRLAWAI